MRAATLRPIFVEKPIFISIHAAHAGCDWRLPTRAYALAHFNPRSPCGLRHAPGGICFSTASHFNPRSPCGLRPVPEKPLLCSINFNPRSPCGLRRLKYLVSCNNHEQFQSTQPMRAATIVSAISKQIKAFQSTQPMRAATFPADKHRTRQKNFNPRSPCGLRHISKANHNWRVLFQSTQPMRAATYLMITIT